jgi:ABC-type multidrug transport system fused ATPase/permease subunit
VVSYLVKAYETHAEKEAIAVGDTRSESPVVLLASNQQVDSSTLFGLDPVTTTSLNAMHQASWPRQVLQLTVRFVTNNYRDPSNVLGGLLQACLLGLLVMVIFWQLGDSLEDTSSMNGLLYIVISMEPYICSIILVERYCAELKVFDRELQDDMYAPSAYFVAHLLSSAPLLIAQPILYSIPIYYGCNARHGFSHAAMFAAVNILVSFTINGMVWMCLSMHRSFSVASLIANTNFTFITLVAGFLVNSNTIPIYVAWVKNISFLNYAYSILMTNQYSHYTVPGCPYDDATSCSQYSGKDILSSQDIGVDDYLTPWCAMWAICIAYYLVALTLLHHLRHPVTGVVGGELNEAGTVEEGEGSEVSYTDCGTHLKIGDSADCSPVDVEAQQQSVLAVSERSKGVTIKIRRLCLSVTATTSNTATANSEGEEQQSTKQTRRHKAILNDVSANIEPGRLVALMGGSGSGEWP